MMSNQLDNSRSEGSGSVHPDQHSNIGFEAASVPAALGQGSMLVSGALRISEDSTSFQTASQGLNGSALGGSTLERTSLEILELAPSPLHLPLLEDDDAISTALPVSNDEELLDSNANVNNKPQFREPSLQERVTSAVNSFALTTKTLSLHLPHLRNVKHPSRLDDVSVTCYDYSDKALPTVGTFSVVQPSRQLQNAEGMSLRQHLGRIPPKTVHLRLIVANDLSTDLIECLGTSFSISPEMYEEHLVNAGWQNGIYNDRQPETWITRDMKKSHMSIKWYRPVKRVLLRPYSKNDRQRFLDARDQPFRWTEKVLDARGKSHDVQHDSRPTTNILRQNWDMKANADATISVGGFAAWEERATVWAKQCDSYRVAVFLLDPLPIVRDEMTGAAEALRRLGGDHTKPRTTRQPKSQSPAENIIEASAPDQRSKALARFTNFARYWLKANRNFSFRSLGRLLFGTSLQPQSSTSNDGHSMEEPEALQHTQDPETGEYGRENQQTIAGISHPRVRSRMSKFFGRLFERSREKKDATGAEEGGVPEEEQGTKLRTLEPMNRCMFEGLYPRGPAMDYDYLMAPENLEMLAVYLDRTKSTAANLAEWMMHEHSHQPFIAGSTLHLECLFKIVQNDTANTLWHMDLALQQIGRHILDETLIQQRLVHWRLVLERFGNELQQLEESLRRFAEFISGSGTSYDHNHNGHDRHNSQVEKLLESNVSQIKSLRQRTTRSYKSLMANMSIVESKRGIAEAESVTKLTELAFFFIPLTFSASVFSMQVKELDASRISIAAFFTLAIIITTASYALRLVIRSERFVNYRRRLLHSIRQNAGLAPGSSIPTKTFLFHLFSWLSSSWFSKGVVVTGVFAGPTAALWTSQLTTGIKVGVTIVIAVLYIGTGVVIILDAMSSYYRSL